MAMYKTSRIISIVSGVIILIFGILSFILLWGEYGASDFVTFFAFPLCGALFIASGLCGIAGGLVLPRHSRAGRTLMLLAGILGLPFFALTGTIFGLAFFMLFLTARNRAVPQWPEEEDKTKADHD